MAYRATTQLYKFEIAMIPIKVNTDVEQSRKLAEILPLASADMIFQLGEDMFADSIRVPLTKEHWEQMMPDINPCWSLAALLGVLPNKIVSHETAFEGEDAEGINDIYYKHIESTEDGRYMCLYSGNGYKYRCVADNPIDACYEMILKLNELNLLWL